MVRYVFICMFVVGATLGGVHAAPVQTKPFQENGVVSGQLDVDAACRVSEGDRNAQVWLSVGQTLLYQVAVPDQGTYEFHVIPGDYELVATNAKGCLSQKIIHVKPKQVLEANLKLEVVKVSEKGQKSGVQK